MGVDPFASEPSPRLCPTLQLLSEQILLASPEYKHTHRSLPLCFPHELTIERRGLLDAKKTRRDS